MNKFKHICLIFVLLILYIFLSSISYVQAISKNLSNEVFRLHVIANSDSNEDQKLKLKVRDNILNYINTISQNINNKNEIINICKSNKEEIKKIALKTITDEGYNYTVNINIGNYQFPTKTYGDITLPSGFYDALKIEIGNASGKNWWCVMFPPLCFIDISTGIVPDNSKEILKNNLGNEEYAIISEDSNIMKFKFKIIEMFENINISIAKN